MKKNSILLAFFFAFFFTSFIFCPGQANSATQVTETHIYENTTWTASGSPYLLKNSLTITESATLTLLSGTIVKTNDVITVNGTLSAQGTAASPIVFTSLTDDSHGGDTNNDGSATVPVAGHWHGIKINATGGQSVLKHCLIQYGGNSLFGIRVEDASPTIEDCTIRENKTRGIWLINASPTINHNTISNQDRGIYTEGNSNPIIYRNNISGNYLRGIINWNPTTTINAKNNYWGHPSGPYDPSDDTATGGLHNPGGLGDRVSDYVDYYPWLLYDPTDVSDSDGDGIPNDQDNCPDIPNADQNDLDEDGIGNLCDDDVDGDGIDNDADLDDDDDGFTDEEEIAAGTDPLDPNSFPNQPPNCSSPLLTPK